MPDNSLKLRTTEAGEPNDRDPVQVLAISLPLVPVARANGAATAGAVLAGASVLSAVVGPDADWVIPATATHVVVPPLTASRVWSLPDVDTYPDSQDLVIADEGKLLGGTYTITLIPLAGSGDTIRDYPNGIVMQDAGDTVRQRRGILSDTWVVQPLRVLRGTEAQFAAYTGVTGQPGFATDTGRPRFMDGTTPGGIPLMDPKLGGVDFRAARDALGLRTVSTADPRFAGGSKPDCTAQGVGTDLAPCVLAAWNYAVATYGHGFVVEVPPGAYRWATPIVLNGLGMRNGELRIIGQITPDAVAMRCCTLSNLSKFRLSARVDRGGRFKGAADPNAFYCDYGAVADVVSAGGQEMFCIDGVFDYTVDLSAYGYAGRLIRITDSHTPTYPATGAIKGRIATARDLDFSRARVPQSLWADPGTNVGQGNFGNLDLLNNDFDVWPPVFVDWNDIKILEIDAAYAKSGPEFRGCVVVTLPSVYVGDLDSRDSAAYHLAFRRSATRGCAAVQCETVKLLNSSNGVLVDGPDAQISLGNIYHYSSDQFPHGTVLRVINAPDISATLHVDHDGGAALYASGPNTKRLNISFNVSAKHNTNLILIDGDVAGPINFSGRISGVGGGYSGIASGSLAYMALDNMILIRGDGSHMILPSGNKVVWSSGAHDGPIAYGNANVAAYVNPSQVISL